MAIELKPALESIKLFTAVTVTMSLKPFLIEFDSYSSTNGTLAVYESGKGVPIQDVTCLFCLSRG